MTVKIAVLFSSYGPYHIARVKAAASAFPADGWMIQGVELSRAQAEYPWQVDTDSFGFPLMSVVENEKLESVPVVKLVRLLHRALRDIEPDVLTISGYFRPTMLFALCWCYLRGKKVILFSESTEIDAERMWWRESVKHILLKFYNAALVGGDPQKRYLAQLGMPEQAIFKGYNVVGNRSFHPQEIDQYDRPVRRKYFLSINRFISKKNLPLLLHAYAEYREATEVEPWDLVLCGDGELRSEIEQKISSLNINPYVHLTGFIQQQEMLPYFAYAECFVHASTHEQWGLVVNEAMAAGLPVIVSNRCGCCENLVVEGVNGFSFDPLSRDQLVKLLLKVSSGAFDLDRMGQAGLAHIQKYSPDYFAQGLKQSIQYALG